MNIDFHYYAAYCAAILAGYTHEESLSICYSSQFADVCTKTLLTKLKAPVDAATTQLQLELADTRTDLTGLQDITRIWASFQFLPYDLYAVKAKRTKRYLRRYRLICKPNSDLLVKTVNLAKGSSLQHTGIAMHILADTWAHAYFAGTPSLVTTTRPLISTRKSRTKTEMYQNVKSSSDITPELRTTLITAFIQTLSFSLRNTR